VVSLDVGSTHMANANRPRLIRHFAVRLGFQSGLTACSGFSFVFIALAALISVQATPAMSSLVKGPSEGHTAVTRLGASAV